MVQVAIGASYSVLKNHYIPWYLHFCQLKSESRSTYIRTQTLLVALSRWLDWTDPVLSLGFSTLQCVSKVETILLQTFPHMAVSITKQLRPLGLTPSHKAITRTLWKPPPAPPSVSNLSLTSHLFFLLAPRQHWDQTQAPLSCSRDKMACVVLGFCDCRWISFLGSPNLLLGPVLNANPAGFIRPVHSIQLYLAGVVLSHSTTNCTSELMA